MQPIELYIKCILEESYRKNGITPKQDYITMNGNKVEFGSKKCVDDLENRRIPDAIRTRLTYKPRTDGYIYYTGIIRILRRELNAAKKKYQNLPV
jgi:hypothetical protein